MSLKKPTYRPVIVPHFRRLLHSLLIVVVIYTMCISLHGQVVINEVDYDLVGSDSGEFIELYNSGLTEVSLSGLCLEFYNGGTMTVYSTFTFPAIMLAADDYYVICGQDINCHCDTVIGQDSYIQNGPDGIILRNCGGSIIDQICYEGAISSCEGSPAPGDDGVSSLASISRFPNGADTDDNSADFVHACYSPGSANVSSAPGTCTDTCPGQPLDTPSIQMDLEGGALYIADEKEAIVLKGQDGKCYRIFIDEVGDMVQEEVECP